MSFNQWLRQQRKRHDPVGDLARDADRDRNKPRRSDLSKWQNYFARIGACDGCPRRS